MARILLLVCLCLPNAALAELVVSDAWIKNLPASVPVRAGYLRIHNPSAIPVSIVAIRSEAFARVEIHQTVARDGMMSMEAIPELTIGAGESIRLAPGGLHLMMMQPLTATRVGDRLEIILSLDDGNELRLPMTVKK